MNLTTRYLGLELASPVVASAGPATGDPATARRIVEAGASAVVLPSLFEEEIVHEEAELHRALEAGTGYFAEALDYFPAVDRFESVADRYLALVEHTKATVPVPVVASLNGTTMGGWIRCARLIEASPTPARSPVLWCW